MVEISEGLQKLSLTSMEAADVVHPAATDVEELQAEVNRLSDCIYGKRVLRS